MQSATNSSESTTKSHFAERGETTQVLLETAIVYIPDSTGVKRECRVMLDSGSQSSFITENCVKSLGLKRQISQVSITGISSAAVGTPYGQLNLQLLSMIHDASVEVEPLTLKKVTGQLPTFDCDPSDWIYLEGLQLADPRFHTPGPIDLLLGADVTASISRDGKRQGARRCPIARNTIFGSVLSGPVKATQQNIIRVLHCEVEPILEKFWELEELPPTKHLKPEEQLCEKHFEETDFKDQHGRYVVELPFRKSITNLGHSRAKAICGLKQMERKLSSSSELKQQYIEFLREYETLHHMEEIKPNEVSNPESYYLPHHCVIRAESTTTKLRVVFDGSAKTTTNISLNYCLMVGPSVQDELFTLLLRFRFHLIALKADVTEFFRQFRVTQQHTDYQRIVWREAPNLPVKGY